MDKRKSPAVFLTAKWLLTFKN